MKITKLLLIEGLLIFLSLNALAAISPKVADQLARQEKKTALIDARDLNYKMNPGIFVKGEKNTQDYQIYLGYQIGDKKKVISGFHGINLYPNYKEKNIVNMIVEIPALRQEKMEINKERPYNPIMYDIVDNKIRKVTYQAKGSMHPGYPFHYGALPQTWEPKGHEDWRTQKYGDNDPIDVFDISSFPAKPGMIKQVKILGAFAMIDGDETDWKLIGIDVNDLNAKLYNDLKDIPKETLKTIEDFLTNYKTPDGKEPNSFAEQKLWDSKEAVKIIEEVHEHWYNLVNINNTVIKDSPARFRDDILKIKLFVEGIF
jgi:inorganic pyrophosphatase